MANSCPFLITVTVRHRQARSPMPSPSPQDMPEHSERSPAWPLTYFGFYDGAVQGAIVLVVEKAELQGTQGG